MTTQAKPAVFGDLASTGKFTSWGLDNTGGTAGQFTAEWTELFEDLEKPPATFGQLPQGVPQKMSVESYRDTREGALWKRTFKLVADELPKNNDSNRNPPRDGLNPLTGSGDDSKDNPMWGETTYKSAAAVFTAKWFWKATDRSKPWPSQIESPGKIDIPANAPHFANPQGQKRNWLYLGMITRMTGAMHEIEESWLLSAAGGWLEDIYGAAALAKKY